MSDYHWYNQKYSNKWPYELHVQSYPFWGKNEKNKGGQVEEWKETYFGRVDSPSCLLACIHTSKAYVHPHNSTQLTWQDVDALVVQEI